MAKLPENQFEIHTKPGDFPVVKFQGEEVLGVQSVMMTAEKQVFVEIRILADQCDLYALDADIDHVVICPRCMREMAEGDEWDDV